MTIPANDPHLCRTSWLGLTNDNARHRFRWARPGKLIKYCVREPVPARLPAIDQMRFRSPSVSQENLAPVRVGVNPHGCRVLKVRKMARASFGLRLPVVK